MRISSAAAKLALSLCTLYAAWLSVLFVSQERLIFVGAYTKATSPPPPSVPISRFQHPDGVETELASWIPDGPVRPLLVYLHGNAGSIARQDGALDLAEAAGYAALLPEYRGYGRSGGTPSERTITADLVRIVEAHAAHPSIDPRRVVYYGRSLGAGFAAQLALERPPAGLILQTPLVRVDELAKRYFAPPFLVRHPFRTDLALREIDRPTLLLGHLRDPTAPPAGVAELARLAKKATLVTIDAGHNDWGPPHEAAKARRAILSFLENAAR